MNKALDQVYDKKSMAVKAAKRLNKRKPFKQDGVNYKIVATVESFTRTGPLVKKGLFKKKSYKLKVGTKRV